MCGVLYGAAIGDAISLGSEYMTRAEVEFHYGACGVVGGNRGEEENREEKRVRRGKEETVEGKEIMKEKEKEGKEKVEGKEIMKEKEMEGKEKVEGKEIMKEKEMEGKEKKEELAGKEETPSEHTNSLPCLSRIPRYDWFVRDRHRSESRGDE